MYPHTHASPSFAESELQPGGKGVGESLGRIQPLWHGCLSPKMSHDSGSLHHTAESRCLGRTLTTEATEAADKAKHRSCIKRAVPGLDTPHQQP